MRIALYARKSTESDDRQVQSLDDQLSSLRELARREGLTIRETFVESRSAKAPHTRPEFARMVARIEAGEIDGVLTWSVNRLARNPVDGGTIAYLLQTRRLGFIRTIERTYRPEDNALLMSIETGMATSFVQNLSRDTLRGMRSKADAGWITARAPIGYLNNLLTHEVDVDPSRFALMRKGWDMLLQGGHTLQDVRRELCRLGLTAPGKAGASRPLSKGFAYRAFSNPFYAGRFSFQGEYRRGRHVPMVSETEFEEAQLALGRPLKARRRRHEFAYSGVLRCGACGCQIVGDRKVKSYRGTRRTVEYVYYRCTGARGCSKRGVRESAVEEAFEAACERIKLPEGAADWAKAELSRQAEEEAGRVALGDGLIQRRAEADRARLDRLSDKWLDGELSDPEYQRIKAGLDDRLRKADRDLSMARTQESRLFALIDKRLGIAVRAGSFADEAAAVRRGVALALGPQHFLTLGKIDIRLGLVMQKIAGFELPRSGSGIPKPGDVMPASSVWGGFCDAIRTSARLELEEEDEREASRAGKSHGR